MNYPHLVIETANVSAVNQGVLKRYHSLPSDYLCFLNTYSLVTNTSDTTWFLTCRDFNANDQEQGFAWNDFELQSLAACEGDLQSQTMITKFWDEHVPIVLSVKDRYCFFALGVCDANFGKVYFGEEPMYEEVVLVEDSFSVFFEKVKHNTLAVSYQDLFSL